MIFRAINSGNVKLLQPVMKIMAEEKTQEKPIAGQKRRSWTNDAVVNGGATSLDVLFKWVSVKGNYEEYRGGPEQSGKTKEVICGEIVTLKKNKDSLHRTNHDVRTKINELEGSYRKTCDD